MNSRHDDVLVIGGGLAGLACASSLARAGLSAIVLEAAADAGGRARSWCHPPTGVDVDIGPHVIHSGYLNFLAFLKMLGTDREITWERRKFMTVAGAGAPHALRQWWLPAPFSLLPNLLSVPGLSARDVVSGVRFTRLSLGFTERDVASLDSIDALDLLRRCGTTERMIDWFWRLASMAVMNVPLERCSAAALLRVHGQLIGHAGTHFGFPKVGLSRLYVRQSTRLIERAGGAVITAARAAKVEHGESQLVRLEDGRCFSARHCVYAVPPDELARLQPALAPTIRFEPSPYKSVYLWFDRPLTNEKFVALIVNPQRLNCDFYDLANIRPALRGQDSVIASNIIYSHRAEAMSEDEIVRRTLEEIAEFAPAVSQARVRHVDVHHIPMAIPCPLVGSESHRPATATPLKGVFLAGDWTRTGLPCSMESAVKSGYLAADAVLAGSGRPRIAALQPPPVGWLARLMAEDPPRETLSRS